MYKEPLIDRILDFTDPDAGGILNIIAYLIILGLGIIIIIAVVIFIITILFICLIQLIYWILLFIQFLGLPIAN